MSVKLLGAILVILGCGSIGFMIAASHRQEEKYLRDFISVLDLMECELVYRLTSLPGLCALAETTCRGNLRRVFGILKHELEDQIFPDAENCMNHAISKVRLSPIMLELLSLFGRSLGRFDAEGQVKGIQYVREEAQRYLKIITENQGVRLRSYQTLGLCAGAAIVIIFF